MESPNLGYDEFLTLISLFTLPLSENREYQDYHHRFQPPGRPTRPHRLALLQLSFLSKEHRLLALDHLAKFIGPMYDNTFLSLYPDILSPEKEKPLVSSIEGGAALARFAGRVKTLQLRADHRGPRVETWKQILPSYISIEHLSLKGYMDTSPCTIKQFLPFFPSPSILRTLILTYSEIPFPDFAAFVCQTPKLEYLGLGSSLNPADSEERTWTIPVGTGSNAGISKSPPFKLKKLELTLYESNAQLEWILSNSHSTLEHLDVEDSLTRPRRFISELLAVLRSTPSASSFGKTTPTLGENIKFFGIEGEYIPWGRITLDEYIADIQTTLRCMPNLRTFAFRVEYVGFYDKGASHSDVIEYKIRLSRLVSTALSCTTTASGSRLDKIHIWIYNSAGLTFPFALLDLVADVLDIQGRVKEIVFQIEGPWTEPDSDARWESLKKTEAKLMSICKKMDVKTRWLGSIWKGVI